MTTTIAAAPDDAEVEAFWLRLLREYERVCQEMDPPTPTRPCTGCGLPTRTSHLFEGACQACILADRADDYARAFTDAHQDMQDAADMA